MFNWIKLIPTWVFRTYNRDLSKHRLHTTKYQDLCM